MSKSLIQTTNQTAQTVSENGIISLGSVMRRYGCNLKLSGNAIEAIGEGYYKVDATISVAPTAEGPVTVAIFNNGTQIPSAIAYGSAAAATPVTLPLVTTFRQRCCDGANNISCVLVNGAGTVQNISVRIEKS